jgi:anti-sigma regulatory factor (Ser/Thr protein kinase)
MAAPTLDAVACCMEFAAAQARAAGFGVARVHEIELVVEEIVANICRYSYADQNGSVELCCERLDGQKLVLEFIDYGCAFNILAMPEPDLSGDIDQRDVGGVGVPVLRALIVQASYRLEEARNILRVFVHAATRLGAEPTAG